MFDFGFWELVLIAVVALLVVGPERLPGVARQAGLWVGKARRFMSSVRSDIEREIQAEELKKVLNQQQSELKELKGMLMETQADVKTELEQTDHLVKSLEDQLQSTPTQDSSKQDKQEPLGSKANSAGNDRKQSTGS